MSPETDTNRCTKRGTTRCTFHVTHPGRCSWQAPCEAPECIHGAGHTVRHEDLYGREWTTRPGESAKNCAACRFDCVRSSGHHDCWYEGLPEVEALIPQWAERVGLDDTGLPIGSDPCPGFAERGEEAKGEGEAKAQPSPVSHPLALAVLDTIEAHEREIVERGPGFDPAAEHSPVAVACANAMQDWSRAGFPRSLPSPTARTRSQEPR